MLTAEFVGLVCDAVSVLAAIVDLVARELHGNAKVCVVALEFPLPAVSPLADFGPHGPEAGGAHRLVGDEESGYRRS